MEFISENLKVVLLAIVALFAGIAVTIRVKKGKSDKSLNKSKQKGNIVNGDMAGRDINK